MPRQWNSLEVDTTGYNMVLNGNIDGTLDVDARTVIGGSVAYQALAGAPAQNNGFDKP